MKKLILNELYSREGVHDIFSPESNFTPQSGTWGMHGIVKVPERENDFVFFVTYGSTQGDHIFDEGISDQGVLSWQSQPAQDFQNNQIQNFINHNDLENNIYLFLREDKKSLYKYFGRLKYISHDNTREKPVYFQWQLKDWDDLNKPKDDLENLNGFLEEQSKKSGKLVESNEKPKSGKKGVGKQNFQQKKTPDYAKRDENNRKIGLQGELLVIDYEKKQLTDEGHPELAELIEHTSQIKGDGMGYDIKSYNNDGSIRYIEVKTTRGSINTDFYISPNEVKFSEIYSDSYYLYRLFNLNPKENSAKFIKIEGYICKSYNLKATEYRATYNL